MKRPRKRRPGHSQRQRVWNSSPACAAAGRDGSRKALELRDTVPKCGARRKGDHLPCQNLALENGRCRLHGGLTPKGEAWHRPRWPGPGAPVAKMDKKLRELERRRKRREAQLAAMSPEERARSEARGRALRPRTKAQRLAASQAAETKRVLEGLRRPAEAEAPSPAVRALEDEIAALRSRLAALNAPATEEERSDD